MLESRDSCPNSATIAVRLASVRQDATPLAFIGWPAGLDNLAVLPNTGTAQYARKRLCCAADAGHGNRQSSTGVPGCRGAACAQSIARPMSASKQTTGRASAHDRLLDAVAEVASRQGFAHLTVERLLSAAAVSRATFYQYFTSVDDCFWGAYRQHAEQLVKEVTAAAGGARSEDRELAVLEALANAAASRPDIARLLMREGLAAGPAGLSERDALIAKLEHAMTGPHGEGSSIDLPAAILIGGTFRFLVMRLSDANELKGLREEVREWAGAFRRRSSDSSWGPRFMPVLPRDRRIPDAELSGVRSCSLRRERILQATALTIREKGYRAITVADIVEAAGVSRRGFYNEFAGKSAAFIGAYEYAFQQILAACTPAFFTPRAWPERVWHGALAFTGFLAREPLLAHLGFVECYAIGPGFTLRVHDTQLAFTVFLEEGYRERREAESMSHSCSELTAATIFEVAFQGSRLGPHFNIRRMQPLAVYIALAPFIGMDAAGEFVSDKLSAKDSGACAAA